MKRRPSLGELGAAAASSSGTARRRLDSRPRLLLSDEQLLQATNSPALRMDSLARISLDVHNIVQPADVFPIKAATAMWMLRVNRFLELERSKRSENTLQFFQKAVFAFAGERLTGQAVCVSRYERGQADVWNLVMRPRETKGAGNCLAYTNAVAALADHFGLFGPLVRIGMTSQHAFLLARSTLQDELWRVVEATSLESYSATFQEEVNATDMYSMGEYQVLSNPNEFRIVVINQGLVHTRQNLETMQKERLQQLVSSSAAAAPFGFLGSEEAEQKLGAEMQSLAEEHQMMRHVAQEATALMIAAQGYPMRTLPPSDPHYNKFWMDKIFILEINVVPIDEAPNRQVNYAFDRLNVYYLLGLRRTLVVFLRNELIAGAWNVIIGLLKRLFQFIRKEIDTHLDNLRLYELDQATRLVDWFFFSVQNYLVPPNQLVLQFTPQNAGYFGAPTLLQAEAVQAHVKYNKQLWERGFAPVQAEVWSPLRAFVTGVVPPLAEWWKDEPGPPLLLYHQRSNRRHSQQPALAFSRVR